MLQLDSGCYGENERKMKIIGRVFTVYCILVVIKHLVMICKVAILLQILLRCLRIIEGRLQLLLKQMTKRKHTLFWKSYISFQECLLFSTQFHE